MENHDLDDPRQQILTILKGQGPIHKHNQSRYHATLPIGNCHGLDFYGPNFAALFCLYILCMHFLHPSLNFTVASSSGT